MKHSWNYEGCPESM